MYVFGVLEAVLGAVEMEVFGVFEEVAITLAGFRVFEVFSVRIWSISGAPGQYFEYFRYTIEEAFRVNEVSRRPIATGALEEVFGVLEVFVL